MSKIPVQDSKKSPINIDDNIVSQFLTINIIVVEYFKIGVLKFVKFKYYIKKLSTDKIIEKVIKDSKNNTQKENFLDKYNNPEYLLKLTLNLDLYNNIKPLSNTTLNQTKNNQNKQILIYNTHDSETYLDNRFNDYNIVPDVKLASNLLEEELNDLGITTYIEKTSTISVLKKNNWNYSKSYQASRQLIEPLIKNNYYNLIIDLHRDSSPINKTYIEYQNKPYAKILFVIGKENTNYIENKNLSQNLNIILEQKIPGISRGIIEKEGAGVNGIYNQDLSPNLLIIELGGQYNKIEDINNTIEILAEAILILLEGDEH